jgi:hypothetical protein
MRTVIASAGALVAALLLCGVAGANPPCSSGCDVPVGTYRGTNDQGKAIEFQVFVLHQKAGPHVVATVHAIRHLKSEFVTTCNGQRAVNTVNSADSIGYINGVQGHLYRGATKMHVLWPPGDTPVGDITYQHLSCTSTTHFKVHLAGP